MKKVIIILLLLPYAASAQKIGNDYTCIKYNPNNNKCEIKIKTSFGVLNNDKSYIEKLDKPVKIEPINNGVNFKKD